jgi:tetratricopeptide (TPR) repeat protein
MNAANVASFVGKLIMVDEAIAEYAGDAPLHTDDNFLLEYSAPRAVLKDRSSILVRDLYRHRSDLSQALQALGWSEDETTGDGLARVLEAKQELAAGYVDFLEGSQLDAIDHLERALSLHPGDYDAANVLATLYFDMGNAYEEAGSPERAAEAYARSIGTIDDVVAPEPASLRVHFDLAVVHARANLRAGMLFLRENALEAAARALQESLAGQVRYAEAHNNLGVVYERGGRFDEARVEYERAVDMRPRYVPGRMNLGNLFLREGRYEEAVESYRQVLEERPDYPMAYYNLGAAYFNQGDLERAEAEWMRALELNPDFAEARSSLDVVRSRMSGQ